MKKIDIKYAGLGIIFALFFLISCNEETLELMPRNSVGYSVAFSTPSMCELSMVGCYDAAQSGYYPGNNQRRGYPFGAASIEQGDMRGEDMLNVQAFFAVTYGSTYNTSAPNGQAMWECTCQMINKINICIEGFKLAVSDGVIDDAKAKDYEGEARFLRALGYHELLIHFARPYADTPDASHLGVPLSTAPINSIDKVEEAKSAGRATVKQVYDQIIEDLNFAEANLPATRAGGLRISRATKGAAIALKVRIYQHMGNMPQLIAESQKIVNTSFESPIGGYKLTAEPNGPFLNNAGNSESIFSIENNELDNATNNGSLSQFYSHVRSLVCISPVMYNADFWLANDKRRTQLVAYSEAYSKNHLYWVDKYKTYEKMADWTPIIRYAEVILNYAEAEARQNGVTQLAVNLLNQIRNRAVVDEADRFTLASFPNAQSLIEAILKERRIEFLGEGRRWADIHRLAKDPVYFVEGNPGVSGVPAKVAPANVTPTSWNAASGILDPDMFKIGAYDYSDRRFLFPIPDSETSTNPKLKEQQNPGW
ncbi:SusD family [Proteiniphilum saccharofermentans]|uniref:SusD family n=1 Tax=Proteiniphilum saccharofermentans TaxID=1642647 RepID=A0A1R3TDU8_9BACT|nr:RagB/SusD family nutrient uptake outer membrane protein [Proteiniphilum saccharofermentans]SCD21794.1 SusD family [Proteiniphilum saccharofermentans]